MVTCPVWLNITRNHPGSAVSSTWHATLLSKAFFLTLQSYADLHFHNHLPTGSPYTSFLLSSLLFVFVVFPFVFFVGFPFVFLFVFHLFYLSVFLFVVSSVFLSFPLLFSISSFFSCTFESKVRFRPGMFGRVTGARRQGSGMVAVLGKGRCDTYYPRLSFIQLSKALIPEISPLTLNTHICNPTNAQKAQPCPETIPS